MTDVQRILCGALRVRVALASLPSLLSWRRPRFATSKLVVALAMAIFGATSLGSAYAQQAPTNGILADGNAVVTGFSGAPLPTTIAPKVDPADKTYIDINGPSARVIDLQAPGAPPQAQLLLTPKPFTVTASQIGQVFGVALDNATPPNIYVAASSVYGLPIVVPDTDGDGLPDRVKQGEPKASFMPGLFGPASLGGGPGSIWRIDGKTGEVRLFANVALDSTPNSGPALGGLAFDPVSNTLFVADRETGMIHAFDLKGEERGHYDHGTQGRQAAGLTPVPFDPATRLDITKPQFQTTNPGTWGYAPPARRIFGLAVHAGRLYYAVAEGLQIWSVAIAQDGSFGTDARVEITVPPGHGPTEISKITFDDQGRMLLAERAAPTGAYDFTSLAQEGIGRVLRYAPAQPGASGARWQPEPDEYAIGFAGQMNNGNGGIAIGYGYDAQGALDRSSCGGFLWSTGEQLRSSADQTLAAQLAKGGPTAVNGLQGNGIDLVRPANVPPQQSYFIDYDDRFDDPAAHGLLGDIAIWRHCAEAGRGEVAPPAMPGTPATPGVAPAPGGPGGGGEQGGPGGPGGPGEEGGPGGPGGPGGLWDHGGLCPPGTHPELKCCPTTITGGQVVQGLLPMGPAGQCVSPCPNGASDAASVRACYRGFAPPANPGAFLGNPGAAICWDHVTHPVQIPPGGGGILNGWKCPAPPYAVCPAGWVLVPAQNNPNSIWSNATCVETAQQQACAAGQQVGLDGHCHPFCPGGQAAWPVCDPGQVPPPPAGPSPKAKDVCARGYALMPDGSCCLATHLTSSGQCCPRGTLPDAERRACVPITPPVVQPPVRPPLPQFERHRPRPHIHHRHRPLRRHYERHPPVHRHHEEPPPVEPGYEEPPPVRPHYERHWRPHHEWRYRGGSHYEHHRRGY